MDGIVHPLYQPEQQSPRSPLCATADEYPTHTPQFVLYILETRYLQFIANMKHTLGPALGPGRLLSIFAASFHI